MAKIEMVWFCCFFIIAQFLHAPATSSMNIITIPESPNYYTAALFEHNRRAWTQEPSQIISLNLDYFERATKIAKSKDADIIIFPEYGITPLFPRQKMKSILEEVPDPQKVSVNPCNQEHEFSNRPMLYRLSCMAKHNNIVVIANTGDIQPCTKMVYPNCPDDGTFHFNANVAFDRDGTLLSKYQKEHLFGEPGMDLPQDPQNPIFETDFGTFAMYICFDISFKHIVDSAQREDVNNIILSTHWINTIPLWDAHAWFEAWALGNNVTLLAANGNMPNTATLGSGVFTGHMGALKYTFNPDGLSKLLISRAPKSKVQTFPFPNFDSSITIITANGSEPYDEDDDGKDVPRNCVRRLNEGIEHINKNYKCYNENTANYTLIKLTKQQDKLEACNNGMCCSLEYSARNMNEVYYFAVFNGTSEYLNHYFLCQENCLVARCDDDDNHPCVTFPMKSNTVFHKLKLQANFTTNFVYPSVVKSSARLAPINEWKHGISDEDGVKGYLDYESFSSQPLLAAVLASRCYDRDPPYVR